jgi:GNAT superfamily N-acetyltransferase
MKSRHLAPTVTSTRISHAVREGVTSTAIAEIVNWAYRGKHPVGDHRAWTGERHLLSGVRITESAVDEMLARCARLGSAHESVLVAMRKEPLSGREGIAGTIHVRRASAAEAELGMFAVDPDIQGEGIGSRLLQEAEDLARDGFGAAKAVMWVISSRAELLDWYRRKGFRVLETESMPFPVGAAVGVQISPEPIVFVKLEKQLS